MTITAHAVWINVLDLKTPFVLCKTSMMYDFGGAGPGIAIFVKKKRALRSISSS